MYIVLFVLYVLGGESAAGTPAGGRTEERDGFVDGSTVESQTCGYRA